MEKDGQAKKDLSQSRRIEGFCFRWGISRPKYYSMRANGVGPKEICVGNVIWITPGAEDEWVKARENPSAAEAEAIWAKRLMREARGKLTAKKAVASPNHISARRRAARDGVMSK
jgi:hypothetical protein